MEDYLGWTDDQGRMFDPWPRSHLSAGGKIIGQAERPMMVEEPVAFWENWIGRDFAEDGITRSKARWCR